MPTRKEVSKLKKDFVEKRKSVIYNKMDDINQTIYDKLMAELLKQSKSKDNYTVTELQAIFKKEFENKFPSVMRETVSTARSLVDLNEMYFSTLVDSNRLNDIKNNTNKILDKKLGIDENGKIVKGGFLDRSITTSNAQILFTKELKKILTGNPDPVALKDKLKNFIVGTPEVNGLITQYYNTFSKDLINTIDRNNGNVFADELGLNSFYYGGGLILTSRPFCLKCNGKIFNREQADKWKNILNTPSGPIWNEKKDGSYDPISQMGGYGCLHNPDWITDSLAQDIKGQQNKKAAERNAAFKNRNGL